MNRNKKMGFSAVEVVVVTLIIGILAAIAIPVFMRAKDAANNARPVNIAKISLPEDRVREDVAIIDTNTVDRLLSERQQQMEKKLDQVREYGSHDTFYFPFAGKWEFIEVLDIFRDVHTNLEFVCSEPDVICQNNSMGDARCNFGATVGHIVFFRKK